MKNKFFAIVVLCLLSGVCMAQTVGYSYKPLESGGGNVKFSVAKQDTVYSVVVTVKSDKLSFLKDPTMLLKNFEGKVIKLYGANIDSGSETAGFFVGGFMLPLTEKISTAQFRITPEQFEDLKNGIAKIRLSTTPIEHEREFRKDKIGKKLYALYLKQRDKEF